MLQSSDEEWTTADATLCSAKSLQSCPTLCDPIDGSPPGSPIPGIPQARILEWVAISFSKACKWKVKVKSRSRVRLLATPWTAAYQAPPSMGFSRQEYWSGVPLPSPGPLQKGMGNHFSILSLRTPWTVWKGKRQDAERWTRRSVGAQYATGDQWRTNSRKNEETEPKQKQYPVVDVTGDGSKDRCCKEQYCIWTWNVRSKNQGKLEVVKQEMARVNIDILGISELKSTGMGEFNSDEHCS